MNVSLKEAIAKGELILFLGAGASATCTTNKKHQPLPDSNGLAEILANAAGLPLNGESLDQVYGAAREVLQARLDPVLETVFNHVTPSREYKIIATFPWKRIYTLNIDDGLERALDKHSLQAVDVFLSQDPIRERDQFYSKLEYIKLNGSIRRLRDGLIFSPSEYARATHLAHPWYSQCASDFVRSPILFIGTRLSEPLLSYHIEKYQEINNEKAGRSYLIVPKISEIQRINLKRNNIEHVAGDIKSFVEWLQTEFPTPPTTLELAKRNIPGLAQMLAEESGAKYVSLLDHVTLVTREISVSSTASAQPGAIRNFYKGFKPTWGDISAGIPAELDILARSVQRISSQPHDRHKLVPFIGPAGSGKTTLLMQLCWHFEQEADTGVYFIDQPPSDLERTLEAIERGTTKSKIIVAIDNLDFVAEQLAAALSSGRLRKTVVIGAERESSWNKRAGNKLEGNFSKPVQVKEFSTADASKILGKLEAYGSWTRLGKMTLAQRVHELTERAQKQLLIALLEATLGRGFEEIIESDFALIHSDDERLFLVAVAVCTDRRSDVSASLVDRALEKLHILRRSTTLSNDLAGTVVVKGDTLSVRHPIYARYLLERIVDPDTTFKAISALLQSFSDYQSPVIKHISRADANLYKGLINHRFLFDVLKGRKTLVLRTYEALEKKFEKDGLFWLQYGLALRDFHENADALDKLKIALEAYPMPHTEHAIAQQLFILADQSTDSILGMSYADRAKTILERIDDKLDSDDTYPVVTLAEGYTAALIRHRSIGEAQAAAKVFTVQLQEASLTYPDRARVRLSFERMFRFASVGTWLPPSH